MQEYVNLQLQESHVALENESRQTLVRTMPFVVNAVTGELFWMQNPELLTGTRRLTCLSSLGKGHRLLSGQVIE